MMESLVREGTVTVPHGAPRLQPVHPVRARVGRAGERQEEEGAAGHLQEVLPS